MCSCALASSATVAITGNGQGGTPFSSQVIRSGDVGNTLEQHSDGLFVGSQSVDPIHVADGVGITTTGDGTPGNPVTPTLAIVGAAFLWFGASAPSWGIFAIGQDVSRTTYARLFAEYGTDHGAGNGSTTFGIPDMRGLFPLGASPIHALGTTGGEENHALAMSEIPVVTSNIGNSAGPDNVGVLTGGFGDGHNNMPPLMAVNFVIVI